jgi:carbon storage regulator
VLILGRKINEVICIGDGIQIMVTAIRGDKVKLGITAPREVSVDRLEIRQQKDAEAAATDSDCD